MDLGTLGFNALNLVIMFFSLIFVLAVIAGSFWGYNYWKKYQEYKVIILENDGFGQKIIDNDTAGVFVDKKTGNKRFFMKRNNVGMDPNNIPYLPTKKGGKKIVFLLRNGLKNFSYLSFDNVTNPNVNVIVGEEDVNWALNAFDRAKKAFVTSTLLQYLPFISLVFVCIVILIIFIYFFKNFEVLKDASIALKEASTELAKARVGDII